MLAVAEEKLGNAIHTDLGFRCEKSTTTTELMRLLRLHSNQIPLPSLAHR